jgi:predicted lipoprotein with Yx(FWY)xxD motif
MHGLLPRMHSKAGGVFLNGAIGFCGLLAWRRPAEGCRNALGYARSTQKESPTMKTKHTKEIWISAFGLMLMATTSAFAGGAMVSTAEQGEYGKYLVDDKGMSLYLFEADKDGQSNCYDACASAWPPLMTDGKPQASGGTQQDLLGTVARKDGSMQVTYGGWPVYYFVKDKSPGDTKGQEVKGFGAEWYLINPEGKQVED